jgi:organic hydroperoxide reductase OsmC/OhrA
MSVDFAVATKQNPVPKPVPFPHHYEVRLEGRASGNALIASPRPLIIGGAPSEFGGSDSWWSPEHLLLASASLCLRATFEALARLKHLEVESYQSDARALLDRTASGPAFTWIRIAVELTVAAADVERARTLLEKAKEHCIVSRSLKVEVQLEALVNGA